MVHPATRSQCSQRLHSQSRGDSSTESEVDQDIESDLFSLGTSSHSNAGDEQSQPARERSRLDEKVELQLILDIDEAGGIKSAFRLVEICNHRPHLFGVASSTQRTRIQKRVNYWKDFPERYYFRRSELGIRTVSAKKRKPQRFKGAVARPSKHEPTPPSPKKPSTFGRPRQRRREEDDCDRDCDRDDKQFLHRFAELKLNMASARFSIENDLAVDAETKARIRGMYKV
jgi:hypothetical protein